MKFLRSLCDFSIPMSYLHPFNSSAMNSSPVTTDLNTSFRRRNFLKQLVAGSVAAMAYPVMATAGGRESLPSGDVADERYWEQVKKQFTMPSNLMMLNAANLCPSPYFINDLVSTTMRDLEKDVSFQFRGKFAQKRGAAIEKMSHFAGVTKEEIGIVRNTSEGNTIIVQGLDIKAGDEILLWDQNHPSNGMAWEQLAKRRGAVVKKVSVPAAPRTTDELIVPFVKAITAKTRIIAFSHISNTSGMCLPAKQICQAAKERNILTLVDGAQTLGMMELNLKDMGCDFYTASTHKWLMGPFENGLLYVRMELLDRLWPNVISAGWKEAGRTVDEKLCILGQRNETTPFALVETLEFHQTIGTRNIESRVRQLNAYLKEKIQARLPQAAFITPLASEMSGGITSITIPGKATQEIYQSLYDKHGIACSAAGGIRLSPHIYNTLGDMDRVVEALVALSA